MINKTDLRIGNSVMYDNRIFQISAITDEFPLLNTAEFGIGVVDWNNIHPIPITEEALVKMGFEQDLREVLNEIYRFNQFSYNQKSKIWYYKWNRIEIDFIHQLQNIIYSLTQTELTYEQDKK